MLNYGSKVKKSNPKAQVRKSHTLSLPTPAVFYGMYLCALFTVFADGLVFFSVGVIWFLLGSAFVSLLASSSIVH